MSDNSHHGEAHFRIAAVLLLVAAHGAGLGGDNRVRAQQAPETTVAETPAAFASPEPEATSTDADAPAALPPQTATAPSPSPAQTYLSLSEVERPEDPNARVRRLRLLEKDYKKYGLGSPIALTAAGGGLALIALYLGAYSAREAKLDCDGDCRNRHVATFVLLGGSGLMVAGAGLGWMLTRIMQRRPIHAEIQQLRRELGPGVVGLNLHALPDHYGANLRVAF
ncbi:MAG: hypothetical protein OEZ06_26165 [Myxococcales bacterium]|nr:hypothetical protein [Myxococcales bacterium]